LNRLKQAHLLMKTLSEAPQYASEYCQGQYIFQKIRQYSRINEDTVNIDFKK